MASLKLLDDVEIKKMLSNSHIVDEFPFLRAAASKAAVKSKCKPCARKNRANAADYSGILAAIAGLPIDRKNRLKQLLGAEQVRFYYKNIKRQKVKITF